MSAAPSDMQLATHRGRVLIATGTSGFGHELTALLHEFDFVAAALARSADQALDDARQTAPDAVLMDTKLAGDVDGIDGAVLLQRELGMRVVYLSDRFELQTIERAKQTLPYGFLLKPVRPGELRSCLELAIHQRHVERGATPSERPARSDLRELLSAREVEVLTLIARGHTSKDVATALRIAKPTVDTYRARLSEKLGLKSRTELMSFAARAGLLGQSKGKR